MISFNYETNFCLDSEDQLIKWIIDTITAENFKLGEIQYVFCDDNYLLKLNQEFLKHDTLTDIISFDYSVGKIIHGEIFISVERVKENAKAFQVSFKEELFRVIIHGVLHYCGYKDKTPNDSQIMTDKENYYLNKIAF